MAFVTHTDNGGGAPDGSDLEFTYAFETIEETNTTSKTNTEVRVALDGISLATNTYEVLSSPARIKFINTNGVNSTYQESSGAPKTGVVVRVYRDTQLEDADTVTFVAGSSIRAQDLNANFKQTRFALQEEQQIPIHSDRIDEGSITSAKIEDGTIVNADINAAAAIAGTKISPDFGSQNIATTGTVDGRDVSTDGTKLDGIETGATADQTNAEIRAAVEAATDSNVFTDADHSKLNAIEASATADQTDAEIRTAVEAATDSNVFTDADHSKLNAIEASATADQTAAEIKTLIASSPLDASHLAANSVTTSEIADAELTTLASMQSGTASILADSTALTSTTAELNLLDGKSIVTSVSGSSTDVQLPTAKAVNDQIVATLQGVGGFYPIDDELKFPNTNPDPNDDAGTIVSIADAGGIVVNGSGVSTTGRTLGGSTVTINGIDSTLNNTTIAAGKGMLVQTTSTLNTYDYHRLIVDEAGVANAQTLVSDFNARYRILANGTSINTVGSLDDGDLLWDSNVDKMKVYNSTTSSWNEVTSIGDYKLLTVVPDGATSGTPDYANLSFDLRDGSNAASVVSVGQLLVSVNGVLQKPNSTSWSSSNEGFHLEGANGIKFCTAPGTGASVFVTLIGSATTVNVPATNSVETGMIQNVAVNADKLATNAVTAVKIADDAVTTDKILDDAVTADKLANSINTEIAANTAKVTNATHTGDVTGATSLTIADDAVVQQKIADNAVNADRIDAGAVGATELAGTLNLSAKTVTLPAASVTAHVTQYNDDTVMSNIAMLGFKVAAANDLAKYNLVDQVIDEFEDSSGIDASASTNEAVTSGYVHGTVVTTPSRSGNWDTTGTDGDYTWWKWTTVTTSGSYTTDTAQTYEYLVVGGGGGGGNGWANDANGSGGGAGAYRAATGFAIAAGTLSGISVGDGNGGQATGGDSVMSTITSNGGGGGASHNCQGGVTPGNGSSSGKGTAGETCSAPTTAGAYGNDGGSATGGGISTNNASTGGGGGAGGNGGNGASASPGGAGGVGLQNDIDGTNRWYAAGGGGGSTHGPSHGQTNGIGGAGTSGGNAAGGDAVDGTGSGGGGASNDGGSSASGGSGGSGVVILRAPTSITTSGGNLTLQSTATTAKDGAPTKADLIILMEDAVGSATEDVDVKGFVSRDGTNFSGAVDFVDEGTWGTNKRILAAHDVDISGIATGTSMKYKIQTLNQSNGSKETKIHAVSLGWR